MRTERFHAPAMFLAGVLALAVAIGGCARGTIPQPRQPGVPSVGGVPLPIPGRGQPSGGGLPSPGGGLPSPGGGLPSPGLPSPGLPSPGLPSPGLPSPGLPSPSLPSPGLPSPGSQGDASDGSSQQSRGGGTGGGGGTGTGLPDGGSIDVPLPGNTGGARTDNDGPDGVGDWEVSTELPSVPGSGTGDGTGDGADGESPGDGAGADGEDDLAGTTPDPTGADDALAEALGEFDAEILSERLAAEKRAAAARSDPLGQDAAMPGANRAQPPPSGPRPAVPRPPTPPVPDTPDARDDDVVARQLREAAEKETDPKLKELLWEEYKRYKAGL